MGGSVCVELHPGLCSSASTAPFQSARFNLLPKPISICGRFALDCSRAPGTTGIRVPGAALLRDSWPLLQPLCTEAAAAADGKDKQQRTATERRDGNAEQRSRDTETHEDTNTPRHSSQRIQSNHLIHPDPPSSSRPYYPSLHRFCLSCPCVVFFGLVSVQQPTLLNHL